MTTTGYGDILRRREARRKWQAMVLHRLGRSGRWIAAFLGTTLLLIVVAGFVEGRGTLGTVFEGPWTWLSRLQVVEGQRPIERTTGSLLVLYCGGWLSVLGIGLLRQLLRFGGGSFAVARSSVDEAVRNRTVVVLLGLLLLALAFQPWANLGTIEQPLRYRIQTFLSFSHIVASVMLGGVTILFATWSVSADLFQRRTGELFVKPIRRISYLLGKWLGVVLLMAVMVTVYSTVTWGVARTWLGTNYALDEMDMRAVTQRVLVARNEIRPQPPVSFEETARRRLQQAQETDPVLVRQRGAANLLNDFLLDERSTFLTVPFGESRTYVFTGLGEARRQAELLDEAVRHNADSLAAQMRQLGIDIQPQDVRLESVIAVAPQLGIDVSSASLQLRFKVRGYSAYGSHEQPILLRANERTNPPVLVTPDEVTVLDLAANIVDEQGELRLQVFNVPLREDVTGLELRRPQALQFDPEHWLSLYYVEGSFGPNLARAAMALWVRLAFLAMLGVVLGSLLSFPVAATASICCWLLAAGGQWLWEVVNFRTDSDLEAIDSAIQFLLMPFVRLLALLFHRYSVLDANSLVVDGRYVSWSVLWTHTLWIGLIWTGVVMLLGWFFFSRKEIARVQV